MKVIRWLACVLALGTLALATIGLVGLRSAAPVVAGDTLVVDPDGQGSVGDCGSTASAYSTISAAVSVAAPGDTVQVCPGTYNEQVVIDTPNLTLSGPNAGVDPGCSGTRPSAEATIAWSTNTGVGTASTVVIAANGVTVDGFTIQNTNGTQNQVSVLIGGHYVGDITRPSDGSNVRNNIISSGYNNVYVWQSSNNTIERNRVLASVETQISIRDNAGQGTRDALRNSVLNNCIDKAGVTSQGHSVAIGVTGGGAQDFRGTLIQGNTMKNSGTGTGHYRGIDANLANGTVAEPVKIYGNTISETSEQSIRIENSNNYDVGGSSASTGNTITGSRGAVGAYRRGITTAGTSTGLSIQYNTVSGHSSTSSNDGEIVVTTAGNTILHNTLFVADSLPTGVGGVGLRADNPSNVLGENTFQGNGQRMLVVSGAPGPGLTVVDATASTFKTASGTTLDPNSQTDLVSIEDRVRHHMDVGSPNNYVLVIFKAHTTVATALNNTSTPGAVQRAIDAVPGSTVVVGPGTYTGTVNISGRSNLDVVGTNRDTVIVKPASTLSWAIPGYPQYDSRQAAVRVVASTGINFSNMTFDFDTVKGNNVAGVFYWDSTGTLNNNVLKNMSVPDASGGYSELTSYIRAPSYTDVARAAVTFSNNVFTDTGRLGIVTHDFVQATIQGNSFTKTTDDFGYAIEMGSRSTGTISGNTISGYDTPAASDNSASAGIYIENSFTSGLPHVNKPVTVSGNTLTGNQYGLWIGNEYDGYTGDIDIIVTVQGNSIHDNTDGGVYVVDEDRSAGSSVTLTASGNTVSNNGATGYYFNTYGDGELHATLTGETITGQATGILVEDNASGSSSSLYDLTVHGSTIGGSSYGINNTTTALLNAEDNWLGSANGPTHASNTFNVGSQGVAVSDDVDFVPWLNAAPPGGVSFAPVTTTSPVGSYASIQAGVNASTGGTVNAKAGTFSEQVSVAKANLTLDGAGIGSTIVKPASVVANTTSLYSGAPIATIILVNGVAGVTVKDLTVDGSSAAFNSDSPGYMGIFYRNASGTIDSSRVTGIFHPGAPGAQSVIGIFAQSGGGGSSTVQVSHSTVDNYGKNGITCNEPGTACTISGNTVTGRGPVGAGNAAQNGIQVGFGATGTVDGNTVSNNSYTGDWSATNILVYSANVGITGNHLNNGMLGLYYIDGSGTISGNTVSATSAGVGRPDYWGIAVSDPPGLSPSPFEEAAAPPAGGFSAAPMGAGVMTVVVSGNTLTGDGSASSVGLEADAGWGPENVSFTASGNTISNWGTGVVVAQCADGCSGAVFTSVDVGPNNNISAPVADPSNSGLHAMGAVNLSVHNNTFTGGYDAIKLRVSVTGTVEDNVVSGYAKNGITVGKAADDNTGTNVTVSGNTVTGGGPGQVNAQNGIQVGPNAVARIQNNTVSNHVYTLGAPPCAGPGTKGDKAYYAACWTAAGIMVYQGSATVTGNIISGNQIGIDDSGAEVHYNTIRDNIIYGENNTSAGVANAENNWWGSCSGPSHPSNPLGTGDAVSDNVDFDPWISGACDYDSDLLTDDQERLIIGTDWQNPDTDGDGCADGEEILMPKVLGGERNPLNPWDFYDITNVTLVLGAKDKGVSGFDLNLMLAWGGAKHLGGPNANGKVYDADGNHNGTPDGVELDFAGLAGPHTGPDGGISGFDLSQMLAEGGDSCVAAPN